MKKDIIKSLYFLILFLPVLNCSEDDSQKNKNEIKVKNEEEELRSVKSQNFIVYSEKINDTEFSIIYPPTDFVIKRSDNADSHLTVFYSKKDNNNSYVWFYFPSSAKTINVFDLERLVNSKGGIVEANKWKIVGRAENTPYKWVKVQFDYLKKQGEQEIEGSILICKVPQTRHAFYIILNYSDKSSEWFLPEAKKILESISFQEIENS